MTVQLTAVVKRDCPTCELVVPVLRQLAEAGDLTIYSQDDPSFPEGLDATDDTDLSYSWHHDIDTVPTLIVTDGDAETTRVVGWERSMWEEATGVDDLGARSSRLPPRMRFVVGGARPDR